MGTNSCLGRNVIVYNVAGVSVGDYAIVSDHSEIITASKAYWSADRELLSAPVDIGEKAWLARGTKILPGVVIGKNSVILAYCIVSRSIVDSVIVKNLENIEITERC